MKTKKIRGYKRKWKNISNWISVNENLDIRDLMINERDYVKIQVPPWSSITLTNSKFPEPKGETKKRIIQGFIDIYMKWKVQLDKLEDPYYLKIWLFEPRFSQSQIVCAIGDNTEFYENTFSKSNIKKELRLENYGHLEPQLEKFKWDLRLDEEYYDNTEVGTPDEYENHKEYEENKKWFERKLRKPHRTTKTVNHYGEKIECYFFTKGCVWIGGYNECV